jgi:hypothetical protein
MEREITSEQTITSDATAEMLVRTNRPFRSWFVVQLEILGMFVAEGQHDRARAYLDRAAEISDALRAMGAVHLLH